MELEGISTEDLYTKAYVILLQPNNTLKHEIQIDNLKNLQKMLSSQNNFSGIT
jgi:hypothetical protein